MLDKIYYLCIIINGFVLFKTKASNWDDLEGGADLFRASYLNFMERGDCMVCQIGANAGSASNGRKPRPPK